jgi:4-amino-4-deoxy-L-arabinose transferase-like glycosyltransferase
MSPVSSLVLRLLERPRRCAAALLCLFAVNGAWSVYHDSQTHDEWAHIDYGESALRGLVEHASAQRMPITALNAAPVAAIRALGFSLSDQRATWVYRLPTIAVAALLGYAVFVWSGALYGSTGGLLSLFVFVFCPTVLAHSRLVTTDVHCAAFSFFAVLSFVRYLDRPSWLRLVAAAVLMGLAQLTKHTALLLVPVLLAVIGLRLLSILRDPARRPSPLPVGRAAVHAGVYLLLALAVLNAGYAFRGTMTSVLASRQSVSASQPGFAAANAASMEHPSLRSRVPLPLPSAYVEAFLFGQYLNGTDEGRGPAYLFGAQNPKGWWYYFPVAFLLKTPIPTLLLSAIALCLVFSTKWLAPASDELVLVLVLFATVGFFVFLCTAQIGVRYLLPAFPFLFTLVGRLAVWQPARARRLWRAGALALLVWLPISVLSYFPHYIAYFNESCWNRLTLYRALADSNLDWDQTDWYLKRYLDAHSTEPIAVNPGSPVTGKVVVRANNLAGLTATPDAYRWLRDGHTPVGHIGYAWLIYDIPPPAQTSPNRR